MELECMSIFTNMSHIRELPLPAHGTASMGLVAMSATVGRAAARCAQPMGCVGLTTVLETIAGPSLQ